ncbi:AcrR family transcriptional regulator [Allocatelliglobosispora scoriae]|uniref:AcrR family transcriptional regulator n=1 Tax=Allocatelliglobosispora scoriae TaxID=643052 RepID=A0A841BR94_9ACTN|nr:TetR family transcriptional regulator [Allocatelliglobosispora scoriae]MBB5869330.1 AcrR family transcriptional regulator [Allocatelliglobosispora scoriae]
MVRRTGRRPGAPDTRETILVAARETFAEKGFDGATMRQIATRAGVDPALVHHYFGTKDQLFQAAVQIPLNPAEILPMVLADGIDHLGTNLVRTFLKVWDSPAGPAAAAVLRSAMSSEWTVKLLREFLVTQVLRRVVNESDLDSVEAPLRISLVATQMAGLAFMRYIIKLEPLASLPSEQVVALIAPNVQRYLTGELPSPSAIGDAAA